MAGILINDNKSSHYISNKLESVEFMLTEIPETKAKKLCGSLVEMRRNINVQQN